MRQKKGRPITFRPTPHVAERLEMAWRCDWDVSEVINSILELELDKYLKKNLNAKAQMIDKFREVLGPEPTTN